MNPEIHDLICRYLDGHAPPDDVRRLDELIRADSAVRKDLLIAAEMEVNLQQLLAVETAGRTKPWSKRVAVRLPWKRTYPWVAALVVAAAGWAFAIHFASQYRHARDELAKAITNQNNLDAFAQNAPIASGRVTETLGTVVAFQEGRHNPVEVVAGTPIPVGRSLWTCPWGGAWLRMAGGVSMRLDRSTEVAISEANGVFRAAVKQGAFLPPI